MRRKPTIGQMNRARNCPLSLAFTVFANVDQLLLNVRPGFKQFLDFDRGNTVLRVQT